MDPSSQDEFVEFLKERVGESLRAVIRYGPASYGIAYHRRDVANQYTSGEIASIVDGLRTERTDKGRQEHRYSMGELASTIRCFDRGITLHLPTGAESGVLLMLDVESGDQLHGFVCECHGRLDAEAATDRRVPGA